MVHATRAAFGAWELTAAVAVAAVLGAVAGAGVARVDSDAAVPSTNTEAQTVEVARHPVRERGAGAAAGEPHVASAWLRLAVLRNAVTEVALRDRAAVGVAVRPLANGRFALAGDLTIGAAWSTIKVPIVLARYRLADARHEARAPIDPLAARALTESDNAAAAQLFGQIEAAEGGLASASHYVGEELKAAGDQVTTINTIQPDFGPFSTYGQTIWSLAAGTAFYRQLGRMCVPPSDAVGQVLALMAKVVPSQRWGVGAVKWPRATSLRFKGGWGPDRSGHYLVRQFAIVESVGGRGFVVGLIARPDDGEFGTGIRVLGDLAAALARSTRVAATPVFSSCR